MSQVEDAEKVEITHVLANVTCKDSQIIIKMGSGMEIRFPVANNIRLARGTSEQLNNIEISPYGLHWPDLDEDLSFRGLLEGDYGQFAGGRTCPRSLERFG
ncbi:MAG: DUF2442 domain-containing protein [Nitrospirae bacterium]|nr:DUF2442 domain-containing protein [Nitrospirota bacterium]